MRDGWMDGWMERWRAALHLPSPDPSSSFPPRTDICLFLFPCLVSWGDFLQMPIHVCDNTMAMTMPPPPPRKHKSQARARASIMCMQRGIAGVP